MDSLDNEINRKYKKIIKYLRIGEMYLRILFKA